MRKVVGISLILLYLLHIIVVKSLNPTLDDDVLGLIVFKADLQDPENKLSSWNEDDDSPCKWEGVKCNPRSNRVSALVLDGFGLSGKMGRGLMQLKLLSKLSLARNNLTGTIGVNIGQLTNLRVIDLSENSFSGPVPDDFFEQCGSLRSISLANNKFSGRVPDSLVSCSSLGVLNFSSNQFSGILPSGIWSLNGLRSLDVSDNLLEGEIPKEIGGLYNLREIKLRKNQFTGPVPDEIGACALLRSETVGKLKALNSLDLSENQLNGSIPSSIGTSSSLTSLILSRNNLSGHLPVSLSKLVALEHVDLSFNKLTGTLPKSLENLVHLVTFNVSHNQLQGELPAGAFFNTISPSSVSNNPTLCGAAANKSCPTVLPKPIVLNPNSTGTDPDSVPQTLGHKKILLSISALIAIGAAAVIIIGIIFITVLNLRVRSTMSRSAAAVPLSGGDFSSSHTTDTHSGKLVMFSGEPDFSTGAHALLNKDCELGRGGFGAVYRTVLGDGRSVAIKKLTVSSLVKSQEDFEREVKKLGKINHPNLVSLEGYYWTPSLQLLIYEYVSGGNLYRHLHESTTQDENIVNNRSSLTWNERFNIILGIAKSLAHLHHLNIIHYNLKSSNVLIDGLGEPKVADFGLARLLPMLDRYVLSSKIQSALGYMAPEFACKTVKITDKCDVYGFGVLVLEIVTGKRPVEYMEDDVVILCDMVRGAVEEGRVDECIDGRLQGKFPAEEVIPVVKLGLICTSQVPSNRPDMAEVINILGLIKCPESQEEYDNN
ncbi:putative protein kinase RLK-Pelle-LRR-VII-1 family [Helianthus annuus]|nr:putative protein kinase RLK-Pelle-LRR-VII-1 family [Helianthus annuus]